MDKKLMVFSKKLNRYIPVSQAMQGPGIVFEPALNAAEAGNNIALSWTDGGWTDSKDGSSWLDSGWTDSKDGSTWMNSGWADSKGGETWVDSGWTDSKDGSSWLDNGWTDSK